MNNYDKKFLLDFAKSVGIMLAVMAVCCVIVLILLPFFE